MTKGYGTYANNEECSVPALNDSSNIGGEQGGETSGMAKANASLLADSSAFWGSGWGLIRFMFFLCGLSTFARSEVILIQTQMYAKCFGLGNNFYAIASCCMFIPGIIIQAVQARYDSTLDKKFTARKAAVFRVCIVLVVSSILLALLALVAFAFPNVRENQYYIYTTLFVLGLCVSVTFGSFSQVASLFPAHVQPYFYFGTYSPFLVLGPVNLAVGDLCTEQGDGLWHTEWSSIFAYYGVGVLLTLLGVVAIIVISRCDTSRLLFSRKDLDLHQNEDGTPLLAGCPDEMDVAISTVIRRVWPQTLSVASVTISSTMIAAIYIDFPVDKLADLPTLLVYDYYIAACLGTILSSIAAIRRLVTPAWLLILSTLKFVFAGLAIAYTQNLIAIQSDALVLFLNSVNMLMGGAVFSLCYSSATDQFVQRMARTRCSAIISTSYYTSIAVALGISFVLHKK